MATLASFVSFSLPHPPSSFPCNHNHSHLSSLSFSLSPLLFNLANPRGLRPARTTTIVAFSASSFDDLCPRDENFSSKKSVLLNLIQEIEPLDVSVIQKDVPITTLDAMKRTISGMLGLLPSDRFQVLIEAMWDPLSKLLVSSMMTGYTLRNAEYRLSLEKNFDMYERSTEKINPTDSELEAPRMLQDSEKRNKLPGEHGMPEIGSAGDSTSETIDAQDLGKITPEAQQYILELKSRLSSVRKELRDVKRKSAALQMQKFVGEEKNDLLDYLRSLRPEKVAELSEPTCPELKDAIYSVVHGLLATLSPKMHSKAPVSENTVNGRANTGTNEDNFDVMENASLQYQPLISLTRDYLARLLFWCMLLGHYLRGLEYRLELKELLSLPSNLKSYHFDGEQAA